MTAVNLIVTWNPMTENWLVRTPAGVTLWANELQVVPNKGSGHQLVLFTNEHEIHIREVAHISQFASRPGFTWIREKIEFFYNRDVTVDGRILEVI